MTSEESIAFVRRKALNNAASEDSFIEDNADVIAAQCRRLWLAANVTEILKAAEPRFNFGPEEVVAIARMIAEDERAAGEVKP